VERLPPFALAHPATLAEAAALLARAPDARLLAGGTDLLPNLRHGLGAPPLLVDLSGLVELEKLELAPAGSVIGAGVTLARLAADRTLQATLPALAEAARAVAAPAHRSVATVGGNLCLDTRCVFYNQSEWWRRTNGYCLKHGGDTCHVAPQGKRCHAAFCGDLAPALLALCADVDTVGPQGARRRPLAALYADDGAAPLALAAGEIVVAVRVPPQPAGARSGYRKARARGAIDFPLAGVAARVAMRDGRLADLRVALTGTNPRPLLLDGTGALVGNAADDAALAQLATLVRRQASPMRTTVTQSNWRRQAAAVLARRLVAALAEPAA
jgi:4-hydroxybenzoyl-CoA reductase subunit beta